MNSIVNPKMIRPFYFYAQKVLPLVYDDSLSYYEVLNKVVDKLNEIVSFINNDFEILIRERLNELFVDALYDAETETLILTLENPS